jgi:3-hydroxybutyryl-CoA dehydrogenase
VPGFVGNRLQHALQREAMALVSSGVASAEEVDLVVTQGFGRRLGVVGPLAVCDLAGLDLVLQVDSYLMPDLADSPEPDPLLVRLVSTGEVGVRSLKGFLEWTPERVDAVVSARDAALIERLREDDRRARDPSSASRE